MYWGIDVRVIGIAVATVVIFFAGWLGNGWRWETKYVALQKSHAEAVIQAQREAKRKEQILQSQADQQLVEKNVQIKAIRTELDRALVELRKRPSRVPVPNAPSPSKGATGADLSREDAEFLIREAARADGLVAQLQYCYRMYDEARGALSGKP